MIVRAAGPASAGPATARAASFQGRRNRRSKPTSSSNETAPSSSWSLCPACSSIDHKGYEWAGGGADQGAANAANKRRNPLVPEAADRRSSPARASGRALLGAEG